MSLEKDSQEKNNVRARLVISGRVQGVFFRAYTKEQARDLGVKGWVRNNSDGSVEIICEGPKNILDPFIDWCRHGPSTAQVRHFDIQWQPYRGEFASFEVR